MATLEQRLSKLEAVTWKLHKKAVRIICKGETPTPEEQQRIDEAERLGYLVIVRRIVYPKHKYA